MLWNCGGFLNFTEKVCFFFQLSHIATARGHEDGFTHVDFLWSSFDL